MMSPESFSSISCVYLMDCWSFLSFTHYPLPVSVLIWDSQVALMIKNLPVNSGDVKEHKFDPWVGKIPWRRKWLPTPVLWPGEFPLYSPWGCEESDKTERLSLSYRDKYIYCLQIDIMPLTSKCLIVYLLLKSGHLH